jgi:hypothetical protein
MRRYIIVAMALLGVGRSDAAVVLHPVWDAIYEYRNFTPREPSYRDNFNTTALHLPVFKTFDPSQGLYSEDVPMIAFDFRSLHGQRISSARLIVVRVDGDLVNPLVANIYRVDDDGVAQREDFFTRGAFASTAVIPPRPSGVSTAEAAIDVTGAVLAAQQSASAFTALRLENAGEFQLDPANDPFLLSSRGSAAYEDANTPRIELETVLEAAIDLRPETINRSDSGRWVSAYIELPGLGPQNIDVATVRLAGTIPPDPKFGSVGDHESDGVPDVMVKFRRSAVDALLVPGANRLEVTGRLTNGQAFSGTDEVNVIDSKSAPLSASVAPNPLNPSGTLTYQTVAAGAVRLRIFDLRGRLVRTLVDSPSMAPGVHVVRIDGKAERGRELATGVYFYRLETSTGSETSRFTILK